MFHEVGKISNYLLFFIQPDGSVVKNPPAMQETQEMRIQSLGQEDPLEKGMATHCNILAWRVPWTEEPGRLQSMGSDNHDGVITHLEPDILECEVNWALEVLLRTKLVEVIEFQLSYFKSSKMML